MEPVLHPESGQAIRGTRLQPGDVLQENDLYSSTNGSWERAPITGIPLAGTSATVVWVRPHVQKG
jgi:hypothetical protein